MPAHEQIHRFQALQARIPLPSLKLSICHSHRSRSFSPSPSLLAPALLFQRRAALAVPPCRRAQPTNIKCKPSADARAWVYSSTCSSLACRTVPDCSQVGMHRAHSLSLHVGSGIPRAHARTHLLLLHYAHTHLRTHGRARGCALGQMEPQHFRYRRSSFFRCAASAARSRIRKWSFHSWSPSACVQFTRCDENTHAAPPPLSLALFVSRAPATLSRPAPPAPHRGSSWNRWSPRQAFPCCLTLQRGAAGRQNQGLSLLTTRNVLPPPCKGHCCRTRPP